MSLVRSMDKKTYNCYPANYLTKVSLCLDFLNMRVKRRTTKNVSATIKEIPFSTNLCKVKHTLLGKSPIYQSLPYCALSDMPI